MAFSSAATDEPGYYQDLAEYSIRNLQQHDLVPKSMGTNQPMFSGPINSPEDVTNAIENAFTAQRQAQGGHAVDSPYTPADQTYGAQRRAFIGREEGNYLYAYDDKTGLPVTRGPVQGATTVGIGFNMDQSDGRKMWAATFAGQPDAPDFDAVRSGKAQVTQAQANALFDHEINSYIEPLLDRKLGPAAANLTNNQRLSLVSMMYQNPSLINTVGPHIVAGDYSAAQAAIKAGTGNPVLAGRRSREAQLFAGI